MIDTEIKNYFAKLGKPDTLVQIEEDFIILAEYSAKDLQYLKEKRFFILHFDNADSGIVGITTPFVVLEKSNSPDEISDEQIRLIKKIERKEYTFGYSCQDCGQIVSSSSFPYHNADHSLSKIYTIT